MSALTLVTGGAGYLGASVVEELLAAGREVRVLDVLLHGQERIAAELAESGARLVRGDVRDTETRLRALAGAESVVHLAAIVGDPACARDPELAREVNVTATAALIEEAREAGVDRFVFASTCSNYGRMQDPTVPIAEDGELRPVSLYAEQKVEIERRLLAGEAVPANRTCLRLATLFGVAPRMRFDLTINEFVQELWAGHELEVYGEQFWRPYVHVREAARAIRTVLEAPAEEVSGEVFNVGASDANYRKLDIVEAVRAQIDSGTVTYVERDEDPRDYKVSFEKIRSRLGFEPRLSLADGIAEITDALSAGLFPDPGGGRYSNTP